MNKEEKYTSLELSKKIYNLAKKKGIELESEYYWVGEKEDDLHLSDTTQFIYGSCPDLSEADYPFCYPALDIAEWGEILKGFESGKALVGFSSQKGGGDKYICNLAWGLIPFSDMSKKETFASKTGKEKKMDIVIKDADQDTVEKIKNIVAEKNERDLVSKKDLENTVGQINSLMERIYKLRPDLRPKTERPFDENAIDDEYNQAVGK